MELIEVMRLDNKGRVIVPKEVREILDIHAADRKKDIRGSLVAFKADGKRIILEKVE